VPDREILTGGPLSLAPGVVQSRLLGGAIRGFEALLNGYWWLVRRLI
jgi:hypothetical protein